MTGFPYDGEKNNIDHNLTTISTNNTGTYVFSTYINIKKHNNETSDKNHAYFIVSVRYIPSSRNHKIILGTVLVLFDF